MKRRLEKPLTFFGMEGGRITKTIPVVVYSPKYDEKLREEYEVTVEDDGTFSVHTTKIAQKNVRDFVGNYKSYDEARDVMFNKFNEDFNRPSEYSIRHMGRSPMERVWDYTEKGREVKATIEISEGGRIIKGEVRPFEPKTVTVKVKLRAPAIITVRELYPRYFNHLIERHRRRVAKVGRRKRLGRLSPRFKMK